MQLDDGQSYLLGVYQKAKSFDIICEYFALTPEERTNPQQVMNPDSPYIPPSPLSYVLTPPVFKPWYDRDVLLLFKQIMTKRR
jgi:hypothetical protein